MKKNSKEIQKVLQSYFDYIELKLPNLIEAYYLYGSISLGAFNDGFSDIDFIAVINRELTEKELTTLKEIHKELHSKYKKIILDGFYITNKDMESLHNGSIPSMRFNDGKFLGYTMFDKNSIDAYQLKKYGITIIGQKIEEDSYTIDWNILTSNMRNNLNTYWLGWWRACKKFPSSNYIGLLFSLNMVEWGVLGVSRLYYSFKEKDITSKVGAGEYALKEVPQKWHKIIHESMRLRNGNKKSLYKSVFKRRKDALDYMEFMIHKCNNLFQ
ncbi:hypothetical protein CSE16_15285 [Solibacillus sp. R5-41]|uniref:aminoglycoside adenylyltransferase domain-containing protein n=1 Tax=Solibacillus sp. R5-41 TaxID=2048654 RepID=UPI000C126848|nr:aminoglycoside adenylyltransferase domain-containing protein [Solibacillus sp. R5-41]ATP41310.1 hypothetical protein CSE16_15285 [Solibacillus sp. R5-41]